MQVSDPSIADLQAKLHQMGMYAAAAEIQRVTATRQEEVNQLQAELQHVLRLPPPIGTRYKRSSARLEIVHVGPMEDM